MTALWRSLITINTEDSKVGCAVISDNHSYMQRTPGNSSIFTAEAKAIDLALDFISTCDANNKFIIFSDSLSVLKAMNHTSSKNPQIQKLLEKCHELLAYKEIVLCWIPSHIGIQGNEMVDKQAKTSLSLEPTSFKISYSNFKPSINKYILEEWQTSWNNSIGNKLLDIKPTIGEYQVIQESLIYTYYKVKSSHNVLVATHHSLYVTSFWNVETLHK